MQIRVLGPVEVWSGGEPVPLGGPRQRAVLAMLALNANHPVRPDALIGGLWGDRAPDHALNSVQVHVSRLRKAFDSGAHDAHPIRIERQGPGYQLSADGERLDLQRFDQIVDSAARSVGSAPQWAAIALREALDLWRGRPLVEFAGMPFAEPQIGRLAERQLTAVVARIDADLALGRHAELLAELDLLTAMHPLDERLPQRLMLALYRSGRQADALDAYRRLRLRLAAELDARPDEALRDLEQAVLRQDPRLDWRPVPENRPRPPAPTRPFRHPAGPVEPGPTGPPAGEPADQPTTDAARRPDAWNVPSRNPHFTGRADLLESVAAGLADGRHSLVVQSLYGLGGVGKTQLAIEYAHRYADRYRLVWWVNAEQPALIGEQLARLGRPLNLPMRASVPEMVQQVLAELAITDRWLLIFDNAERAADVARFRPSGPGHILVTSRAPGWGELGGRIAVDVLDRDETIALLRSRIPDIDVLVAADLAAELGDLPLAVAQAVAHIEQSDMDPADYLSQFSTRRSALLARGSVLGYQGRVDTAWDISFDRLRLDAPAALTLMTYSAFLGAEPIPESAFAARLPRLAEQAGAEQDDPLVLADAVGAAAALSLVRRQPGSFQVHRLVQAVIRGHLDPPERTAVAADVAAMVAAAHPGDPNLPTSWPGYAALAPHVFALGAAADGQDAARHLVLDTIAYLNTTADAHGSRLVAEGVHDRWGTGLGPGHRDTLTMAAYLALAVMWDGDAATAARLGTRSLDLARRELGVDDPVTLRIASYLVCALAWLAQADRARELTLDTLERVERTLPATDADRLRLSGYLSLVLVWVGAPDADGIAQRILENTRSVLGANHPTTLLAATDLALGLLTAADVGRLRAVSQDAWARAREVLGPRHLITLGAAAVLGVAACWTGDRALAAQLDEQFLSRTAALLGSDHVITLMAVAATATIRADDIVRPGPHEPEAVERARRLLGPDHPITLITQAATTGAAPDVRDRVDRVFAAGHPLVRGVQVRR